MGPILPPMVSSNVPSLYARYVKERESFDTIERPEGFMTYRVQGDTCYIRDLYVLPEHRKGGVASAMADAAASAAALAGCVRLMGTVDCRTAGYDSSLRVLLAYGFKLSSSHEGYLILHKELTPPGR